MIATTEMKLIGRINQQSMDLTNFKICHTHSKFCDCPTRFMAKQHWSLDNEVTDGTMSQVVNIRPTDTNGMNCNLYFCKHDHCTKTLKLITNLC